MWSIIVHLILSLPYNLYTKPMPTQQREGQCTSLYTAWARAHLGLLLEMNWHNELALCQFISKSSPRRAQAVYVQTCAHLCTDLLFAVLHNYTKWIFSLWSSSIVHCNLSLHVWSLFVTWQKCGCLVWIFQ